MAASRKLQAEVQQVLKKVEEGVEEFNTIWEKVYAAESQALKEKYETDLKKEIKKLQRLRDQIKSWISSNDIKDKNPLLEAKKVIESKMEQFKICEKDTKTKAYSKEGLAREAKVDPKEAMREEKRNWLNECLEKIFDIINTIEAEKEKIQANTRGNKSKNKEMLEKLDNRILKHKWHVNKIELIIRLLDSEELDPFLLDSIKDSLEYYLETAADDDGNIGVEDEFDIYEDLELDSYAAQDAIVVAAAAAAAAAGGLPVVPVSGVSVTGTPVVSPLLPVLPASATAAPMLPESHTSTTTVTSKEVPVSSVGKASTGSAVPAGGSVPVSATASKLVPVKPVVDTGNTKTPPPLMAAVVAGKASVAAVVAGTATPSATTTSTTTVPPPSSTTVNTTSVEEKGGVGASSTPVQTSVPAPPPGIKPTTTTSSTTSSTTSTSTKVVPPPSPNQPALLKSPARPSSTTNATSLPLPLPLPVAATTNSTTNTNSNSNTSSTPAATVTVTVTPTNSNTNTTNTTNNNVNTTTSEVNNNNNNNNTSSSSSPGMTSLLPPPTTTTNTNNTTAAIPVPVPVPVPLLPVLTAELSAILSLLKQSAYCMPPTETTTTTNDTTNSTTNTTSDTSNTNTNKTAGYSYTYTPRTPYAHTHPTFPTLPAFPTNTSITTNTTGNTSTTPPNTSTTPLTTPPTPSTTDHTFLIDKLGLDSLFFTFYFQPGSNAQALAAKKLKKNSWRFHKKYTTWFQRHTEPKVATQEYEEGTYVYFDYESGWCQRIKSEFKFEYAFLEDEIN